MTTLSLIVDDQLAQRAERIAVDRNTTLDHLVQDYLEQLSAEELTARAAAAARLSATIRELSRPLGGKSYHHRDELYER